MALQGNPTAICYHEVPKNLPPGVVGACRRCAAPVVADPANQQGAGTGVAAGYPGEYQAGLPLGITGEPYAIAG